MQIDTYDIGGATVLRVGCDRLDAAASVRFKDMVRDATRDARDRVILDLAQVTFMDSSGLGAIIGAHKLIAPERTMEIAALTPAVDKVFRLTRIDRIFVLHADVPPPDGSPAETPPPPIHEIRHAT